MGRSHKRQDVRDPLPLLVMLEPRRSLTSLDLGYDFLFSLKSHCRCLDAGIYLHYSMRVMSMKHLL